MARVSPEYAEGLACPHCGRPLRWIGRWVPDHNSPDGWSYRREPFTYNLKRPVSRDAREVKRIDRQGYEGKASTLYAHQAVLCCHRCNRDYTAAQASHVPPPPPEGAPAGYYMPEG